MRDIILKKLQQLSDAPALKKIYFGVLGQPPPPGAAFQSIVRFDIIISGEKKVTLPLKNGPTEVCLNAGDAHYNIPNSWELQTWNSCHEMLCIVPRIDYLRVSYYRVEDDAAHTLVTQYYHTGRPYSDIFRNTLEAMNCCARQDHHTVIEPLGTAIIRLAREECLLRTPPGEGKAIHTFRKIRSWVENSIREDLDRNRAARVFGVSPSYVSQLFRKTCGMNFHEYVTACRLNFARELLCNTELTVYQIADQCGFRNYVHFVRRFREKTGIPPGKYREAYLAELHAGDYAAATAVWR